MGRVRPGPSRLGLRGGLRLGSHPFDSGSRHLWVGPGVCLRRRLGQEWIGGRVTSGGAKTVDPRMVVDPGHPSPWHTRAGAVGVVTSVTTSDPSLPLPSVEDPSPRVVVRVGVPGVKPDTRPDQV